MIKKYNIAFVPIQKPSIFIDYAISLSHSIKPEKYLLGAQSLPHVSICHCEIGEHEVETIWHAVTKLSLPTISLTFNSIRCKSYSGHPKWGGVCWLSLVPDKIDLLKQIHLLIAQIIKVPLNSAFDDYDPHLTLLNSFDEEQCNRFIETPKLKTELTDDFSIVLGEIDEEGQLLNILYESAQALSPCKW